MAPGPDKNQNSMTHRSTSARLFAISASILAAFAAGMAFLVYGSVDGLTFIDIARAFLIVLSTWWLAWGAATAFIGLLSRLPLQPLPNRAPIRGRTVIIVPVYNEDPVATFARIAAMDDSLSACTGLPHIDFAVLSDTRDDAIAEMERVWFTRLVLRQSGEGRIFYRRRDKNIGRKAGNIEDFIVASGAAWDYAVILDADSLMEGETILEMIHRIDVAPDLGLLQTLPRVIGAQSIFGRAMQFAAGFHSPIFARGLAAMQGRSGPFWGHNAIVRIKAWAESCGLPSLSGPAPFGGHIMSHDSVEAAMLARMGWTVRLDDDLEGSFEGGPENIIDHAKRDRRWCQGNLQHSKVIAAPDLLLWSRFALFQGIFSYIAPLIWLTFIAASIAAIPMASELNYFPKANWPFPIFPNDETSKAIGLALGIFGLLVLPKFLVGLDAILTGRANAFGGVRRSIWSVLAELALSSLIAPIFLAFQSRSVIQVLLGRDSGWPTNNRGDGGLNAAESWAAGRWISLWGIGGIAVTYFLVPALNLWLLPVTLPLTIAPLLIWWTSRPSSYTHFMVPSDETIPPVLSRYNAILDAWTTTKPEQKVA